MIKRFLLGLAVGGAAVYLFDPENGAARRAQLQSWWRENEGSMREAGRSTVETIKRAQPAAEQAVEVGKQAGQKVSSKMGEVTGRGGKEGAPGVYETQPGPAPNVSSR
jgi:gas vesicle protein